MDGPTHMGSPGNPVIKHNIPLFKKRRNRIIMEIHINQHTKIKILKQSVIVESTILAKPIQLAKASFKMHLFYPFCTI